MFVHLGGDVIIPIKEIIAILDVKITEESKDTAQFLQVAREEGFVQENSEGEPKSFIITDRHVYLSPISSFTLRKRSGFVADLGEYEEEEKK